MTLLDGREETRRRRRTRRRTSANDAKNIFFFFLFSLILLFFDFVDDDGAKRRSGDVVGVVFVGASRAGGGRPSSSAAAAARRPAATTTAARHRQQQKQQQNREIEEKKRRIQKKEDERRAAIEEEKKSRAALLPPKEEEEEKEGRRASEMHSSFQPPNEQGGGEEEKKESIPEETTEEKEEEEEEEAPTTTTEAKVPSEEVEALPRSSSPEEAEEDTTTETSPVEEEVKNRGEGEEEKEQEQEQAMVEVQESDALSIGDLGTDSPSETDFDAVSKNEERGGGTVSESETAPITTSPEEEQAIDDAIVPPEEQVVKTEEEEEQVDGEIAVGAEEEQPSVEPVAAPELGEAKEEKILKDEEKSDEKANEQLSKYEALIKEEEEEELEKMEKTKEDGVQAQEQTEEGSVVAEEKTPEEIEELPQPLDEEKKEEEDAPSQKTEKEVIFGGKSDTHDPLFIKDNEEEKAQVEENAPMQEADALSMDFTSDDAAPTTDGAEEKEKKASEEVVVASEETPVVAPSDELESTKEEEKKKVEQEDAPIKKEEEEEPEQEKKDWDKSHGVYEALLESEKSEEAVADAIVSADKSSDGDANITTSSTTKGTKVLGGIPKSLGVVSASPLTNPSLSFAAFRFSKRLGYAFARPGKCICAGSCECAGACGSSMDSLEKQSTALKDAGVDAGISVISDASLVYNEDLNLERWIGEIADPAKYGLERLYAAVEYYISTDVENEDATFYSIMNKSPYPELAKCDVFDAMFSQLREDRKNGKTVKVNVDAKDEAKLAVLTACDGFVNNPQATKFGGGTSAKEIAQRFDAIIPADSGLDGLISLTFMSGFAISDLAYGANEEDSKISKMRKEMGISVDLANEAEAVLKRLRESNKVDEELYKQSTAWLDGVKEAHRKAFNAHKAIVEVWMEESDQYCESSSTGSKTCTRDDSSSTTTTTTDQFAELLGSFPESCKASDPKTRSCVDDWWDCEGPGSEGSAFAGQFSKTSATTTTTTMTTPSDATGDSGGSTSGGKGRVSAVEALSNFKYKVMYDREHPLNKAAQFGAHHSKKFARGTMNAVNVGAGHAVANFKKIPTGVHAGVAIMFIFSLFGYYTYSQYKSLQPVSSLELNTSSVKVLKAFENKEKALRGISNVPAGELMRDDAFWGGGLSQSEMERGTAGRGSSRLTGGKRRNRNTKSRGPMTEEELNFYDDVSD